MKQRSPIAATLLSLFIPFYILYWFYVTAKVMATKGAKVPPFSFLIAPFLVYIGFIILVVAGGSNSVLHAVALLGLVVSFVLLIVLPIVYYWQFSHAADELTGGKVGKVVAFVLFLLIAPVSVYIVQDGLNTAAQTPTPPSPVSPDVTPVTPAAIEPQTNPMPPTPPSDTPPQTPIQ